MMSYRYLKTFLEIAVVLGIAIAFLLPSSTIAINFANENNLDYFDKEIKNSYEKNEMIFSYKMPDLIQEQVSTQQGIFTRLEIPGTGFIGETGKPQIPYATQFYAVPTLQVSLEIVESHLAESYDIGIVYPAQGPHIDSKISEETEFIFDEAFYNLDETYPGEIVEIIQKGMIRDIPFVKIGFYPIQYNPQTEIAKIYDEITIRLSWVGNDPLIVESNFEQKPFYKFYENVFMNWAEFSENTVFTYSSSDSGHPIADEGCDYLIITNPNFENEAEELGEWKHKSGLITKVVTTSDTGDGSSQIRDYIQNAYDTWDPCPSYVLLIGDAEFLPTNYLYIHPYHGIYTASDLWYATVSGSDYYPDIFIGRIPADTANQADLINQKILNYEKSPPSLTSFYDEVAVCAYFQDEEPQNGYEDRRFVRTSEEIRDYLLTEGYDVERIYVTPENVYPTHYNNGWYGDGEPLPPELLKPGFPWDGDYVDIRNAINQGSIIVNHRDHGGIHAWGDPYFDTSHINSLSNGDLLPIVFSINCQTGWFDGEESFCEVFIKKSNGGTVGIVGATRVSYSGYNDYLCLGFYDAVWPEFDQLQGGDTPLYSMGQMLNYGKSYMANTWGDPWDVERVTFEMFHWFGDPSMEIWTDVPDTLIVDHPSEIEGSGEVTVTVYDSGESPVEGAVVCISNEEGIYGRGITDENGVAIFEINHLALDTKPFVSQDASLVVKAHDYIPYEATITVESDITGDVNGDGLVNMVDLLLLLVAWGESPGDPADLNGDGVVNVQDLLILLSNWISRK